MQPSRVRRARLTALVAFVVSLSAIGGAALASDGVQQAAAPTHATASGFGGPVVLMGIDAEDGGPGGHGPIANYVQLTQSVLADVTNGGHGILVIGGGKSASDSSTLFWDAIGTGTGEPVTYVNSAANISAATFTGKALLAVSGSANNTGGGLTNDENTALNGRSGDVAGFINGGGGLIGLDQYALAEQYEYMGGLAAFTSVDGDFSDIDPTPAGIDVGVTDALDVCCWHQHFSSYPSFMGVLAYVAGTQDVAALGGTVVVPPEDCTNGIDDDQDGLIDGADPDCVEGPPGTITCFDTIDNDGDGLIDQLDPDCQGQEGPAGSPTCTDTIDNDGDGLVDGADPDCVPTGTEGPAGDPTCSDTVDNDGDGLVDRRDPDCKSAPTTEGPFGARTCSDGADNDGDTLIDGADPDCAPPTEGPFGDPTCSDTVDNDGDGLVDSADPDCAPPPTEGPAGDPTCSDGADNDGDGTTDQLDPDCQSPEGPFGDPSCSDGVDNDGDGFTDINDVDCAPPPVEPCSDPGILTDPTLAQTLWNDLLEDLGTGLFVDPDADGPVSSALDDLVPSFGPLGPAIHDVACMVSLPALGL